MFYLIYISKVAQFFSQGDLESLLKQAREKNTSLNITGVLLYQNGHFMQILEGDERDVKKVYSSIRGDLRHKDVTTIIEAEEPKRVFPDWAMAFRKLDGNEEPAFGYSDYLSIPITGEELQHYRNLPERMMVLFKMEQITQKDSARE